MELIIGVTCASGIIYGTRLLEVLNKNSNVKIDLIISENAKLLIEHETNLKLSNVQQFADNNYENSDLTADIASGSRLYSGMVIVPCSMSTLAKINTGLTDNLITRVADVCLKEQRKLIVVPRETPVNTTHLKNLLELSQKNVTVLPAMPAFYQKPNELNDLIDFIVGKILDSLSISHDLVKRWDGKFCNLNP
jgi:4-hydroxy-3-polyprenylbenzoate decarboxylase